MNLFKIIKKIFVWIWNLLFGSEKRRLVTIEEQEENHNSIAQPKFQIPYKENLVIKLIKPFGIWTEKYWKEKQELMELIIEDEEKFKHGFFVTYINAQKKLKIKKGFSNKR